MSVAARRRGFRSLMANRGLRNLFAGQVASGFGDWMATIALMALVLDMTRSSTAVGGVLVLRLAPTIVAGPFTTRMVQRFDRVHTMLAMDAARVVVAAAIPLVRELWWVYAWAFVLEGCGLVFLPARDALIPDLIDSPDEQSESLANSLMLGASYGTIPLGAGAFAVLAVLLAGSGHVMATSVALWVDALSFALSFLAIRTITQSRRTRGGGRVENDEHSSDPFLASFKIPLVRALLAPALVAALGIGSLFSLGVTFVRDGLGATDTEFGLLVALFGVGAAVGLLAVRLLNLGGIGFVRISLGVQGAVIAVMSLSPTVLFAFLGAVGFGAATAATLAASMTVIQEKLDGAERVRAFTAFHVVIRIGLAVAAIAAGVAADLLSSVPVLGETHAAPTRAVLFISGGIVVITAIVSGFASRDVGWKSQPTHPAHGTK